MLIIKRMGVMNITPDSFSDGGELDSPEKIHQKLKSFGMVHALDVGAESTAPINTSISWEEEWGRWQLFLPFISQLQGALSADTYHPETIFQLVRYWKNHHLNQSLFWNDVSGKFDDHVRDFLKEGKRFEYVYCHNRAPTRALTGRHMDYVGKEDGRIEEELGDFFGPKKFERVIFDPCLGFSKTYDENWYILKHFEKLQKLIRHEHWLLGFSRKSFLRKRFNLTLDQREELDRKHLEILTEVLKEAQGVVWIRTHRPELIPQIQKV